MTEHRCEQCSAENAPDAQFCTKCDFYLGWDSGAGSLGNSPLTSGIPVVRETYTETGQFRAQVHDVRKRPAGRPSPPPHPHGRGPHPRQPPGRRGPDPQRPASPAAPPKVALAAPELTVDPKSGGTFDVTVQNNSSIVDGYTVTPVNPPPWLAIEQPEMRLLTKQEEIFTLTLTIDPQLIVYVQRFRLPLQFASIEDPSQRTVVELLVVVPRFGPPATMMAEPRFIRLLDQTSGRFRLHLDNRNSNYPQRFGMRANDQEGVVRFRFQPQIVEVPPAGVQTVDVQFDAPVPEHGAQIMRTLTVIAANNESPIEAIVNLEQRRSQAPADQPVALRLDPSVVRKTDETEAEISVLIDNRRGSRDRKLYFSGRDPEGRIRFGFAQQQLYVRAGEQARLQARISAPLPRPGERDERPFSVICNDGSVESEASGMFGIQASTSPISTAELELAPEHVIVQNTRKGRFRVMVDNTRGALPLGVLLSGNNPEGAVRFTFNPQRLEIQPGQRGYAELKVEASRPPGGEQIERELTIEASDGIGSIEAKGRFTQKQSNIYPLVRLVCTLLGGVLVIAGALTPWFDAPLLRLDFLPKLKDSVMKFNTELPTPSAETIENLTQPIARVAILVLAAIILLGILSAKGKWTILGAFAAVLTMGIYAAYALSELTSKGLGYGVILVIAGGIIGAVGGFCAGREKGT